MTIVNKESSWTPPPENLLMVMNIMEQLEKEGNREHASNPDDLPNETKVSNNFPSEAKNGLLSPLKYNLPNSVRYSIDEMLNTDFKQKNHKFEERSEGSSKENKERFVSAVGGGSGPRVERMIRTALGILSTIQQQIFISLILKQRTDWKISSQL